MGQKNDVVDNVNEPTTIYGVCDGEGGLINHSFVAKKKVIKNLRKIIKKNLSYE